MYTHSGSSCKSIRLPLMHATRPSNLMRTASKRTTGRAWHLLSRRALMRYVCMYVLRTCAYHRLSSCICICICMPMYVCIYVKAYNRKGMAFAEQTRFGEVCMYVCMYVLRTFTHTHTYKHMFITSLSSAPMCFLMYVFAY